MAPSLLLIILNTIERWKTYTRHKWIIPMKQIVLNTLDKPEIRKIAFGFGTIYINALSFESVKEAIKKDKIKVEYKSSLGANTAKYRYTANTLFLGFKDTGGSTDREALIVHECVHAIFDIAGKTMLVKQSEAAAYVTQVLYFYYRNESVILAGSTPTFKDPILKAAWDVAMIARRRSNITEKEVAPLYTAISKHSLYKNNYNNDEKYDGV